ncbi:helix-turn-helix domain-containing protein [Vagococcus zengguangii]|nr:helix-turn-helix domain-containing protein [Vagococcus zengguangii]
MVKYRRARMVAIGERIKKFRQEKELTQQALAEKLHVSRSAISNWEIGRNYPDLDVVILLSDVLAVSLDDLLREDQVMVKEVSQEQRKNKQRKWRLRMVSILLAVFVGLTGWLWYQEVGSVHQYISPSMSTRIAINSTSNEETIAVFEGKSYLEFTNRRWQQTLVNDASSSGSMNVAIYDQHNQMIKQFLLEAGQEQKLAELEKNTRYKVVISATEGDYWLNIY